MMIPWLDTVDLASLHLPTIGGCTLTSCSRNLSFMSLKSSMRNMVQHVQSGDIWLTTCRRRRSPHRSKRSAIITSLHSLLRQLQLHFSSPTAHHDIYNNKNRWDKEETLYRSFGEDESSFGFLTHVEAKERRDAMSRLFSTQSIEGPTQQIVRDKA